MALKMTGYDEWVKVEQDSAEWVFVNQGGDEETMADAAGAASGPPHKRIFLKDEPDVDGDGNEDQNQDRGSAKRTDVDEAANEFCAPLKFCHGACEVVAANGCGVHLGRVSQYGRAHGFCKSEACEHADDKGVLVVSYESLLVGGSCEDDDGYVHFDIESADGLSEDACSQGGGDDDDYEEEEEEEDDDDDYEEEDEEENDEYNDGMHQNALQDEEANKHTNSLMDAIERYYMNPVKEGWQEYICSVQTETRRELHETKMVSFRGYGPQPRPFIDGSTCFNPLFEQMWLPWAINAEYCHDEDLGLLVFDGATGLTQCSLAANEYMSSAVPILPVLEYMVNHTPGKKIAHIGLFSSMYWAALLQQLGASNVIVTEGSCTSPVGFSHIEQIDEEMFFMLDMVVGQALFFLRPSKRAGDAESCMAERCLFCFPGDTIFFVGERGKHADNFGMAEWVEEHALEGWHVEKEMEIPCWPGSHDVFLCITKASMPIDMTT